MAIALEDVKNAPVWLCCNGVHPESLLREAYRALSFSSCSLGAAAFSSDLLLSLLKFNSQGIRLAWRSPALYPIPSGLDGRRIGAAACAAQYLKKHVAVSI